MKKLKETKKLEKKKKEVIDTKGKEAKQPLKPSSKQ